MIQGSTTPEFDLTLDFESVFMGISSVLRAWKGFLDVLRLPLHKKQFVFYAEDAASWCHFEDLATELADRLCQPVVYITSCLDDLVRMRQSENFKVYFVGRGLARVFTFLLLKADVMILTMPDLETFEIKRSRRYPVHYVYLFHSMVSSHMIYRSGAFDHFDAILCVGPHHAEEIRRWERKKELPAKRLITYGYGRLDSLRRLVASTESPPPDDGREIHVLVAPSWGPEGLMETKGRELISLLLKSGFEVTVRPHPMTIRKYPRLWNSLQNCFGGKERIRFDEDVSSADSLENADIMISDWSGVALEFAFAWERPVLFVDVPRKINNPDYELVELEPIEVSIRPELGEVCDPDELHRIPEIIRNLVQQRVQFRNRIHTLRKRVVYHLDRSGRDGAKALVNLRNEIDQQPVKKAA